MSDTVRVYINAKPVDAPAGASALDAVKIWDAAVADEITSGTRALTDSRGLPIDASVPLVQGAIFRVVRRRDRDAAGDTPAQASPGAE
jgi:hypothetical protein